MSISRHRDLRTGQSVWQAHRVTPVPYHAHRRERATDVLVVGAGITGALLAERLTADGHDVIVVDRRPPVHGSTPASTALIQYDLDVPLSHLADAIGWARASRIWRRSSLAVTALHRRITRLRIDAALEERESLYLDGDVLGRRDLRHECVARQRAGLEVEYLEPSRVARLFGISGRAAIRSEGNIAADPRRLASALLRIAVRRGARVLSPVEVTDIEATRRGVDVRTAAGRTIRARHLVLATGYEMPKVVPASGHRVVSTWAIATVCQPRRLWPRRPFVWEASDPYLYIRATADGRVICGGEDEPFADEESRDAQLPHKTSVLQRRLAALLPSIDATPAFA
ncbi:MAG: FAD-binding oxidoreductase, partial [Acidobacteria bacterium]|nr:FAD-binding oxidoreductase [Acidobacteriota bacterium]